MAVSFSRWLLGLIAVACVGKVLVAVPALAQQQPSTLETVQSKGVLRVGWATLQPDFYRVPGTNEYRGMAYDIVVDLAKTLNVKLELVEDNWSTLIAGIQSGKFDITIPLLGITLPRALAVSFSRPVFNSPIGLMIRKQDGDRFKRLSDFDKSDVRLTVTLGSNTDMFVTRTFKSTQLLRVKGPPDSLTQLLTGRAEAWAAPSTAFRDVVKEQETLMVFENGIVGFSPVSFAFRAGDYRFKEWIDYYIGELIFTGQLRALYAKHGMPEENFPK